MIQRLNNCNYCLTCSKNNTEFEKSWFARPETFGKLEVIEISGAAVTHQS